MTCKCKKHTKMKYRREKGNVAMMDVFGNPRNVEIIICLKCEKVIDFSYTEFCWDPVNKKIKKMNYF